MGKENERGERVKGKGGRKRSPCSDFTILTTVVT